MIVGNNINDVSGLEIKKYAYIIIFFSETLAILVVSNIRNKTCISARLYPW